MITVQAQSMDQNKEPVSYVEHDARLHHYHDRDQRHCRVSTGSVGIWEWKNGSFKFQLQYFQHVDIF